MRHQHFWFKQTAWKEERGLKSSSLGQCVSNCLLSPKAAILDPQVLTDGQLQHSITFFPAKPRMWSCVESIPKPRFQKQVLHFFTDVVGLMQLRKKRSAKRKEKAKTLRCSERRSVCGRIRTVLIWHTKFGFQFNPNEHPKHKIDFQWFYGLQEYHCRNP